VVVTAACTGEEIRGNEEISRTETIVLTDLSHLLISKEYG
jgi:hypothetical protein